MVHKEAQKHKKVRNSFMLHVPLVLLVPFCGSLSGVHVPADVDQIIAASDKHLGGAAACGAALSVHLGFEKVRGVNEHGVAVNLYLGFGKFEPYEFSARIRKTLRVCK